MEAHGKGCCWENGSIKFILPYNLDGSYCGEERCMNQALLTQTRCLLCGMDNNDEIMYPARIFGNTLTSYAFSAR